MTDKQRQLAIRTIVSGVPLCGCGSTDRNWAIVRQMLERSEFLHSGTNGPSFYDPMPMHNLSGEAVEWISHALGNCTYPLLEHGTSAGFAWLTEAGKVLLHFLRENPDHENWPEYAESSSADEPFTVSEKELEELLRK